MKKLLKFLSLTLTLILTFSFIGCNKTSTEETDNLSVQLTSSETVIDREKGTVTKTLTATVYPENATNKKVDWYIDWDYDEEEGLPHSLVVTDYVKVKPLKDGSNVAQVTCYKGFEDVIKITAVTRAGNFSAVCYVEYDGAPENFIINIDNNIYTTQSPLMHFYSGDTYTTSIDTTNIFDKVGAKYEYSYSVVDFGGNGIINVRFEEYDYEWSDDGRELIRGELINDYEEEIYLADKRQLESIQKNFSINNIFNKLFTFKVDRDELEIKFLGNESYIDVWDLDGVNRIKYLETVEPCTFYVTIQENITGITFRFNFDIENRVTSVSLDNSTLYF